MPGRGTRAGDNQPWKERAPMSHDLERLPDGRTAFAAARTPAWHQLGTVTTGAMTAAQVIQAAQLASWNVRKIPVIGRETIPDPTTGNPRTVEVSAPDRAMTVRTNPVTGATDYLGVVGLGYTPVQNEACAELLDLLIDASGGHFETAGSLHGGRRIFVTLKLPQGITIAGFDHLDLYLALSTSHDGSTALRVDATPVRVVCANTQRLALKRSVGHYTFRHTTSITSKISQAREAIGISYAYADAFTLEAERMLNTQLAIDGFRQVCDQLWPTPPADAPARTVTNHRRRWSTLEYLFTEAPTQDGLRDTAFGAWQSVIEYLDHHAPAPTPQRRAERVLTSTTLAAAKQKAHDLLIHV
jgi:phage/plasmid-like protein (TIGR03299 family)